MFFQRYQKRITRNRQLIVTSISRESRVCQTIFSIVDQRYRSIDLSKISYSSIQNQRLFARRATIFSTIKRVRSLNHDFFVSSQKIDRNNLMQSKNRT